jgi:outer membrane protein assembly factor BamB
MFLLVVLILAIVSMPTIHATEWPGFRGDGQRSASVPESLSLPLSLQWRFNTGQRPSPAWPEPARGSLWQNLESIEPRVTEDRVFQPAASRGRLFFGSSTDDHFYCLDAHSGKILWRFASGGPIRFAPWVEEDRVCFGSDDGHVYCLEVTTGDVMWRTSLAHEERWVSGNGRMISAWPIRTGVVVADGTLYTTAGLFPSQGIWIAALDLQTGKTLWQSELAEDSPQGYLLVSPTRLYLPTGRANPISVDRETGRKLTRYSGVGGSYALLFDDALVSGQGNDGTLVANDGDTGDRLIEFGGRQMVVSPERAFLQSRDTLSAIDRTRHVALVRDRLRLEKELRHQRRQVDRARPDSLERQRLQADLQNLANQLRDTRSELDACQLWQVDNRLAHCLIRAGEGIIAGGEGGVALFRESDGKRLWEANFTGTAGGMAIHRGTLFVSTTQGEILAFRSESAAPPKVPLPDSRAKKLASLVAAGRPLASLDRNTQDVTDALERLQAEIEEVTGYCLVVGIQDGQLCRRIAEETSLQVIALDSDRSRVEAFRQQTLDLGIHGKRLSAIHLAENRLPMTDYFATAVVINWPEDRDGVKSDRSIDSKRLETLPADELKRVLRPHGGVLLDLRDNTVQRHGALENAGSWEHLYGTTANRAYNQRQSMAPHLQLQWFGGPGPARMIDRHLRGHAPLADSGRLYIIGQNALLGVDAFTGLPLWERDLPTSPRYSMPYDAGYATAVSGNLFVAVEHELWELQGNTGRLHRTVQNPAGPEYHWGFLAVTPDQIVGSLQAPTASRTQATREAVDLDYRSQQGLVSSEKLFVLHRDNGQPHWTWDRKSTIINTTITVSDGHLYFVESRLPEEVRPKLGRVVLSSIHEHPAYLVCLRLDDGTVRWEKELDLTAMNNIVYLAAADQRLILSGSRDASQGRATYHLEARDAETGRRLWHREHFGRRGDLHHGEQVQHPVIMESTIVSEPYLFDLKTGEPTGPDGEPSEWSFQRPGHSCGTMTGAGECLFFRANNPVRLHLGSQSSDEDRFVRLAPSRTGCWINAIPALGLVLIPEASAGCVCHYSLQTSMAFLPVHAP